MQIIQWTKELLEYFIEQTKDSTEPFDRVSEILKFPKQKIIFTSTAANKMWALVDADNKEIGWHGLVKRLDDNTYEVYDILVYPQTVTGATVTADEKEFMQWQVALASDDNFPYEDMKMHGHSHVSMGVGPSTTDIALQKDIQAQVAEGSFYIHMIVNKKRDFFIRIIDKKRQCIFATDDCIFLPNEEAIWAAKQMKEFIKAPKPSKVAKGPKNVKKTGYWESQRNAMAEYLFPAGWEDM